MTKTTAAIVGALVGLILPMQLAFADGAAAPGPLSELTAEWWQWALSIPTGQNPQLDPTGQDCMVGQRGPLWFLAGAFISGPPITRNCEVPEDKSLFFTVANAFNVNAPNVVAPGCDQGVQTVKELRMLSKATFDGIQNVWIKIDNVYANYLLRHVVSDIFEVVMPEDNVFDTVCGGPGNVPGGVYSPAVDEGYYVTLPSLKKGDHSIHFHADIPGFGTQDVTYKLTVVPVSLH